MDIALHSVNLPQIIEQQSPDFFHTFTVHFVLAPVVLHPGKMAPITLQWSIAFKFSFKIRLRLQLQSRLEILCHILRPEIG